MNLIILDQNFDTLGVVSVFNTLIWDRRYYASGLFELHTPAEFFTLMNTGRYLYRNDRDELGVIREVNFAKDAKGTRTAYCKGYFSEELLNGRVLNTQISLTGTPEVIGRKMVDRYVINPTDAGRKISRVKLGELKGIGASVTVTATGDNLGDKLYEIEKTQELSHRLRYDYLNNDLIFEVWKGKDRTDDQTENSWAIFSDSFYNVKNAVYDRDESEYKNFAYVAGEGEGSARVIVEVDLRSSADEERRELYVDARDLQSTYQDDAGDEHTYTADQYKALLRQRGLEKLAEYQRDGSYQYLLAFEESYGYMMGDYVRDKDAVTACVMITEMAAYYFEQGMTLAQALDALYEKYGFYGERTLNLVMPGLDGLEKMRALMAQLRREPLQEIAGTKVVRMRDYEDGSVYVMGLGRMDKTPISGSNVLYFELDDGCAFIVRPSGTCLLYTSPSPRD